MRKLKEVFLKVTESCSKRNCYILYRECQNVQIKQDVTSNTSVSPYEIVQWNGKADFLSSINI